MSLILVKVGKHLVSSYLGLVQIGKECLKTFMTFQEKEKKKFRLNKSLHVQFNTIRCNMNQLTYIECKQKKCKSSFKILQASSLMIICGESRQES